MCFDILVQYTPRSPFSTGLHDKYRLVQRYAFCGKTFFATSHQQKHACLKSIQLNLSRGLKLIAVIRFSNLCQGALEAQESLGSTQCRHILLRISFPCLQATWLPISFHVEAMVETPICDPPQIHGRQLGILWNPALPSMSRNFWQHH